jgi:hypothetical protein
MARIRLNTLQAGTKLALKGMRYRFTLQSSERDGDRCILHGEHEGRNIHVVCAVSGRGLLGVLKIIEED